MTEALRFLGVRVSVLAMEPRTDGGIDDPAVYRIPRPLQRGLRERVHGRLLPWSARASSYRRRVMPIVQALHDRDGLDLLQVYDSFGHARLLTASSPVPVVARLHGPWFLVGPVMGQGGGNAFRQRVRYEGQLISRADAVSAPSSVTLDATRSHYGLALPEAQAIPNPCPQCPTGARWTAADADSGTVVFVGRFDRVKGGDLVIDAFRSLAQRVAGSRLVFVGPDRGLLMRDGTKVGIETYARDRIGPLLESGRFAWLGAVRHGDLPALRKRAGVVVVASRFETIGNVVLEAMAQGCPLVASDAGGIPEVVTDGHDGLLFRGGDAEDLAARIELLLRDRELAARLGANAYRTWYDRYRPEVVARRMLAFYEDVIDRSRAKRR